MSPLTSKKPANRGFLALAGVAAAVAALGAGFVAVLAGASVAATSAAPKNTGEPSITGSTRAGETLQTTTGSWSGTQPFEFTTRWFRCEGRGEPDASDCDRISNAGGLTYTLRQADVGFRLRSQVTAENKDGKATATSNPTNVIQSAKPVNTKEPSISGSAVVGRRLTENRGEWAGETPITYAFRWLRCNPAGQNCGEISGATDTSYVLVASDAGRTIRVRVTARNDVGSTSAVSNQTARVQTSAPPPGDSIPVESLQAGGDRLVVAQVQFSPRPVTSRTDPITVRVRVTARQSRPVRGALVFMRATPRVVEGQTRATESDGWVTLQLVPNANFPEPRNGYNVQFFIKAYRTGDPSLGGIAGYRLVQVPLAR